jgi:ribonuclease HI
MFEETEYVLYFDGCSKGNPGPSAAGYVLYRGTTEVFARSEFISERETNNVAEYTAMIMGLREAFLTGVRNLLVRGDSLLVISQMTGKYKVSSSHLREYYEHAVDISKQFQCIQFEYIPREKNKRADELANRGLPI